MMWLDIYIYIWTCRHLLGSFSPKGGSSAITMCISHSYYMCSVKADMQSHISARGRAEAVTQDNKRHAVCLGLYFELSCSPRSVCTYDAG